MHQMEYSVSAHRAAIAVAPNGGRRTRADHPALPQTARQLAEAASACLDAGAAMIHCHVRDDQGRHILDADAYRDAIGAIRKAVGERLVIQITTEAVGRYGVHEQMDVVRQVRPEAVSLALRELVPDASHEEEFSKFLSFMRAENIAPQIILYHPEEALQLKRMMAHGLIPFPDIPVLYVLGRYTEGQRSDPADLLPFLDEAMPDFAHFMVCAFGPREAACVTAGCLLGGHARVGFENNLYLASGAIAPDNAAIVSGVAETLSALGTPLETANGLRESWGLGPPAKGR
ncbi:3-keto-5-aminohexanoate cleavage protein [Nitratireductor sp. L1-7-SE]|uniref:3-keto-5-aminohexanoate cleavage protein n=1 Tax=Nitratireductor rhodophyticola TaxID=2854036 RepID=A0ABS7R728_9HYPH|nr:3-keto-5-aminohexanoate cleavage protein [Nitratireductor rhodophyticola]MBY8916744.1 3-keto-5-aminohexanoate cleavage protein [Nitratireductor rhodophyticola]MBY8920827.1 3-keto-5-aminohexanoate cleavage protein [Nitratireductor rhodophyticola]